MLEGKICCPPKVGLGSLVVVLVTWCSKLLVLNCGKPFRDKGLLISLLTLLISVNNLPNKNCLFQIGKRKINTYVNDYVAVSKKIIGHLGNVIVFKKVQIVGAQTRTWKFASLGLGVIVLSINKHCSLPMFLWNCCKMRKKKEIAKQQSGTESPPRSVYSQPCIWPGNV